MADHPQYLFVYGTLLSESQHPMSALLQLHASLHGAGSIQARLYLIEEEDEHGHNSYPGAVPSPWSEDKVYGRVYEIHDPEPVYSAFNDFEACVPGWPEPYEFLLRPIDVLLETGNQIRAASYLYTWDTSRATHVASGRYELVSPNVR